MDAVPCWLLTDEWGETSLGDGLRCGWGRGITHSNAADPVVGYVCDSAHLPLLLDPLYERHGTSTRLWLSEVTHPCYQDPHRVADHTWTTLDEWPRPQWVGSELDGRIRLRLALLAAARGVSASSLRLRLRSLSLDDLGEAAWKVEQMTQAVRGSVPQALSMAAMALHDAARLAIGRPGLEDRVARRYPLYAWYAAMAASCACIDLSALADEAVRMEWDPATARRSAGLVTVS